MKSSKKKRTYYFKQKCLDKDFLDNYLKTKQQDWKEVELEKGHNQMLLM